MEFFFPALQQGKKRHLIGVVAFADFCGLDIPIVANFKLAA